MGSVGVIVAILGGLVAMLAGLGRQDWVAIGLGLGIIGLAFTLWDGLGSDVPWRRLDGRVEPELEPELEPEAEPEAEPEPAATAAGDSDDDRA